MGRSLVGGAIRSPCRRDKMLRELMLLVMKMHGSIDVCWGNPVRVVMVVTPATPGRVAAGNRMHGNGRGVWLEGFEAGYPWEGGGVERRLSSRRRNGGTCSGARGDACYMYAYVHVCMYNVL